MRDRRDLVVRHAGQDVRIKVEEDEIFALSHVPENCGIERRNRTECHNAVAQMLDPIVWIVEELLHQP